MDANKAQDQSNLNQTGPFNPLSQQGSVGQSKSFVQPPYDPGNLPKNPTPSDYRNIPPPKSPDYSRFPPSADASTHSRVPSDSVRTGKDNPESMRSDTTSSNFGEPSNKSYVDSELEKHIFTYGPYVPSRISQSSVPRPQALTFNPESETLYQTGKHYGLIPTFGNHRILDTGSASPIYITPTYTELPIFGGTLNDMKLPFGTLVQPFAQNLDDSVPELDFLSYMEKRSKERRDLIRCTNCMAYYNAYMSTKSRTKNRVCNFCLTSFFITDEQMEALDRINSQYGDKTPIRKGSIDYVAPSHYYEKNTDSGTISNLISRASSIGVFKIQNKQESYIYDTFSVSPLPIDNSGNYQKFLPPNRVSSYEGTQYPENPELEKVPNPVFNESEKHELKYPVYLFIIESTSEANRLELKKSVLAALINSLDEIEDEVFDFCVFIYDCCLYTFTVSGNQFSVYLVTEVEENFVPCTPDEMFLRVTKENKDIAKEYLNKILNVQTLKISPNSCGNFALNCGVRVLASENRFGTISMFYVSQPDVGLGTDPQTFTSNSFTLTEIQKYYYDSLLQMCYSSGICVDVYMCPSETRIPGDIALQHVSQQTGGNLIYLPRFTHKFDYFKVYSEIVRLFKVPCGYKCELKLRSSKFIKVTEVLCGFHNTRAVKNPSTLSVPRIGPDLSIGFMLTLNDMVDNKSSLYLQCACLYTNSKGIPMLRLHTQCIKVISSINEVFKNANQDAIMNLLSRRLAHSYIKTGKYNREQYINLMVEALTSYRHICAPSTPQNQLILPDNLKLLPAYLNSLLKYEISSEYGMEFIVKLLVILNSSVKSTYFIYTRTYSLHRSVYEKNETPPETGYTFTLTAVPSSSAFIYSDGIYLMDDGYKLLMFVGPHVKSSLILELFGPNHHLSHSVVNSIEVVDTPTSRNLMEVVEQLRSQHKGCPYVPLKIINYSAKNSKLIKTVLLEDESAGEPSYINFLVSLHKRILDSREKMY